MADENETPVVQDGLDYWAKVPASVDGVLGGFGNGPLPRVDAQGSRNFLMRMMPHLCLVPSSLRKIDPPKYTRRIRALDVGAGIGRVTSTVLLALAHDVILLEPTPSFIGEAIRLSSSWRGISDASKSVTFLQGTLQDYDPRSPTPAISSPPPSSSTPGTTGFDIIWCQWCLGHLADPELVSFFRRCKEALRDSIDETDVRTQSLIIVKENVCFDNEDGTPATVYDPEDSSVTRGDLAWKAAFQEAGLTLLREEEQLGLPKGLFAVKS
ncbi:DUF858-domain-containing protein [Clavulina sp. PMI_390]|nr:DUF858-domain-containing protein [Clavulina sp. PMI_390]